MSLKRTIPVAKPKAPQSQPTGARRIIMPPPPPPPPYPAEICEPTRVALELAGISVLKCSAEWAESLEQGGRQPDAAGKH